MDFQELTKLLGLADTAAGTDIREKILSLVNLRAKFAQSLKLDAGVDDAALESALAELSVREETARKAKHEAEADEVLKPFEGRIKPEALAAYRGLLISDRETALTLLNGLALPEADPAKRDEPPEPKSDPAQSDAEPDNEAQAAKIKTRAQEYQSQTPGLSWAEAWAKAENEFKQTK